MCQTVQVASLHDMLQWLHHSINHSLESLHSRGLYKPNKLEGMHQSFHRQALTGWWQTLHLSYTSKR